MKNLELYETYQESSIRYTEEEIEKILIDFDGIEFFKLNPGKDVKVEVNPTVGAISEEGNSAKGEIGYYLELITISMSDTIYDNLEKMFERFSESNNSDDELNDLKNDLDNVGFNKNKSFTWSEIKARIKNFHNLDRSAKWIIIDDKKFIVELTSSENMQYSKEFIITLTPKKYDGKLVFDDASFIDDLLDDLFYEKK